MTAEFLQAVAAALPGAVIEVDGVLVARDLVLDKPITLWGGTLRAAVVVQSPGVVLSRMRLEGVDHAPTLRVLGGDLRLERCVLDGGHAGIHVAGGAVAAEDTTLVDIVGDGVDVISGQLRMKTCQVSCGGVGLRAAAETSVVVDGLEVHDAGVGLSIEGCSDLGARAMHLHHNGVNLDVVEAELTLEGLDIGPSTHCGVRVHPGASLTLREASLQGVTAVAALVIGGRLCLDACAVRDGLTTVQLTAGTLVVTGSSIGPASPGGVALRLDAGAVKLAASSVHNDGFAWSEATIVCLDTSFDGAATALAVRAPGSLHADGSTFGATEMPALRLDGADAVLERCHLRGREGLVLERATATLRRCEVHSVDEGIGLRLSDARLTADKCIFRGGAVVVDARKSTVALTEVKVSGGDATYNGICADDGSPLHLERCQVDGVLQAGILAHTIDADNTHILGGAHWGVRISGHGARAQMRRCLIQAPAGFSALSADHVELVGCNLEGKTALALGPHCTGSATRCAIRGTQTGVFVFDYGVRVLLDDCTVRAPLAIDYKRGYALTVRGGEVDGVVRVEDRKLVLDGIEPDPLEVGPRGRVDRDVPEPQLPAWTQPKPAARHIDVGADWHRYHALLDDALDDPNVALVNLPDCIETAPALAMARRVGPAPWPVVWEVGGGAMRTLDDFLGFVAVWIRGATGDNVVWEEIEASTWPSRCTPAHSVRGTWRCGGWQLVGDAMEGDDGNPRDGYNFEVLWRLTREEAPIFVIEGSLQGPFPTSVVKIEAPSIAPDACWRAAALVHAWNKTL